MWSTFVEKGALQIKPIIIIIIISILFILILII